MAFITVAYIVLLVIVGIYAGLISRHLSKYGFFSPKFKIVAIIFGAMGMAVILFSLYMLLQLYATEKTGYNTPLSTPKTTEGDLNF
ncbi:MAG: hypothetical protein V1760_01930 [Candidatus Peregrinibacteria bacterium]